MAEDHRKWSVEDHLRDVPPEHVRVYRLIENLILSCGDVSMSARKTTIAFKGRDGGQLNRS